MPTIKDIARVAGVSPTTVSNVIHGNRSRVSASKVAEIEQIIREMGYVPNMSARALVSHASHIIGVITYAPPGQDAGTFQDPFHSALFAGIERGLQKHDYYLMMRTIHTVPELLSLLSNWNLDGLILSGIFPEEYHDNLLRQRTPFLLIDSYLADPNVLQVRLEDRWGGYLATRYLLQRGHRRILFCGPSVQVEGVMAERFRGYKQGLIEFGIEATSQNVYEVQATIDDGRALGARLAQRRDYTAIFATADILAAGILSGLQEAGRQVPEEISIVGFDDLSIARLTSPQLSTVHQDVLHKGEIAVEVLVNAVQEGRSQHQPVVLPVHMVPRQSTRDINGECTQAG